MLKRAGSDFRSKVSVRMMFIYAVVLIAFFGISFPAAAGNTDVAVKLPSGEWFLLNLDENTPIKTVKVFINKHTNIPTNQQRLFYIDDSGDEPLYDGIRLWQLKVSALRLEIYDSSYPPDPEPTTEPVYEEPVFYALPEDEIGAYAIRQDGTKEYLLFHTYDICMDWLASDELCSGFEHCFHKDGK
jgi:hypothetical protein